MSKEKQIPPKIDTSHLKLPVTSKLGDNLAITLVIRGIPAPKIRWFLGSKELGPNQPNVRIRQKRHLYKIYIGYVTEELNNGITVHASNKYGEDFVRIEVKVYKILSKKSSRKVRSKSETRPPSDGTLTEPRKQLTLARPAKSKSLPRGTSFTKVQYKDQRRQPSTVRYSRSFDDIFSSYYAPINLINRNSSFDDDPYYSNDSGFPSPSSPRRRLFRSTEDVYRELKSPKIPTLSCDNFPSTFISIPPSPVIKRRAKSCENYSQIDYESESSNSDSEIPCGFSVNIKENLSKFKTGHESRSRRRVRPKPINSEIRPFNVVVDIPLESKRKSKENIVGDSQNKHFYDVQNADDITHHLNDNHLDKQRINRHSQHYCSDSNNSTNDCSENIEPLKECIDSNKVYKVHIIDAKLNKISQLSNRNSNTTKSTAVASITVNSFIHNNYNSKINSNCNNSNTEEQYCTKDTDETVAKSSSPKWYESVNDYQDSNVDYLCTKDTEVNILSDCKSENLNTNQQNNQDFSYTTELKPPLHSNMDGDNPRNSYQSSSSDRSNLTDHTNFLTSAEVHNPEPKSPTGKSSMKKKKILKKEKRKDIIEQNNAVVQQVSVVITETTDSGARNSYYSAYPPAMMGSTTVVTTGETIPITCSTMNAPEYSNPGINSYPQLSSFAGLNNNNDVKNNQMELSEPQSNDTPSITKVKKKRRSRSKSSERKSVENLSVKEGIINIENNGTERLALESNNNQHDVMKYSTIENSSVQQVDINFQNIDTSLDSKLGHDKLTPSKVKKKKRSKSQDNILDSNSGSDMFVHSLPSMDNSGIPNSNFDSDRSRAKSVDDNDADNENITPKLKKKKKPTKSAKDTFKSMPSLPQDNDVSINSISVLETDIDAVFNETKSSQPKRLTPRQVKRKKKSKSPEKSSENEVSKSMPSLLQETDLDAVILSFQTNQSTSHASDKSSDMKVKKVKKKKSKMKEDDLLSKSMPTLLSEDSDVSTNLLCVNNIEYNGDKETMDTTFDEYLIDGISPKKGKKKKKTSENNEQSMPLLNQETSTDECSVFPSPSMQSQPEKNKTKKKKKKEVFNGESSCVVTQTNGIMHHHSLLSSSPTPINIDNMDISEVVSNNLTLENSASFSPENAPEDVPIPETTKSIKKRKASSEKRKSKAKSTPCLIEDTGDLLVSASVPKKKKKKKIENESEIISQNPIEDMDVDEHIQEENFPLYRPKIYDLDEEPGLRKKLPKQVQGYSVYTNICSQVNDQLSETNIDDAITVPDQSKENHSSSDKENGDSLRLSIEHNLSDIPQKDDVLTTKIEDVNSEESPKKVKKKRSSSLEKKKKSKLSAQSLPSLMQEQQSPVLSDINNIDTMNSISKEHSSFDSNNTLQMEISEKHVTDTMKPDISVLDHDPIKSVKREKQSKKKRKDVKSESDILDNPLSASGITETKVRVKKTKSKSVDKVDGNETVCTINAIPHLTNDDEVFDPFLDQKPSNSSANETTKAKSSIKKAKSKSTTYLFEDIVPKPIMTPGKYDQFGKKEPPIDTSTPLRPSEMPLSNSLTKVKKKKKKHLSASDDKELETIGTPTGLSDIALKSDLGETKVKKNKQKNSTDSLNGTSEGIISDPHVHSEISFVSSEPTGEKVKKKKKKNIDVDSVNGLDVNITEGSDIKIKKIKKKKTTDDKRKIETDASNVTVTAEPLLDSEIMKDIKTTKKKKKKYPNEEEEGQESSKAIKRKKKHSDKDKVVMEISKGPADGEAVKIDEVCNTFEDNFMDACILEESILTRTDPQGNNGKLIFYDNENLEAIKTPSENPNGEHDILDMDHKMEPEYSLSNDAVPTVHNNLVQFHDKQQEFDFMDTNKCMETDNSVNNANHMHHNFEINSTTPHGSIENQSSNSDNFQTGVCQKHILFDVNHYPEIVEIESENSRSTIADDRLTSFNLSEAEPVMQEDISSTRPTIIETITNMDPVTECGRKKPKKKKVTNKEKVTSDNCVNQSEVNVNSDTPGDVAQSYPQFVEISTSINIDEIPVKPQKIKKVKTKKSKSKSMENILSDPNRSPLGDTYLTNQTIDIINSDLQLFEVDAVDSRQSKSMDMTEITKDTNKKIKKKKKVKSHENHTDDTLVCDNSEMPTVQNTINENEPSKQSITPSPRKEKMTPRKVKKKSKQKKMDQIASNMEDNVSVASHNSEDVHSVHTDDNGDVCGPRSEMERSFAASEVSFNTAVSSIPDVTSENEMPISNEEAHETVPKKVKKKKKAKDKMLTSSPKDIVENKDVLFESNKNQDSNILPNVLKMEESDTQKFQNSIDQQIPEQGTQEKVWEFLGYKLGDVCKSMLVENEGESRARKEMVVETRNHGIDLNESFQSAATTSSEEQYTEIKSVVSGDFLDNSDREDLNSSDGEGELNKSLGFVDSNDLPDDINRHSTSQAHLAYKYRTNEISHRNMSKSSIDLRHRPLFGAKSRENILSENTNLTRNKSIDILCPDDTEDIPFLDSSGESQTGLLISEKSPVVTNAELRKRQLLGIGRIKITGKQFGNSFKSIGISSSSVKPYKSMSNLLSPDRVRPRLLFSPARTPEKPLLKPTLLKSFKKDKTEGSDFTSNIQKQEIKTKSIKVETVTTTRVTEETTDTFMTPKRKQMLGKTALTLMKKSSLDEEDFYKEPKQPCVQSDKGHHNDITSTRSGNISEMEIYEIGESITFNLPKESEVKNNIHHENVCEKESLKYTSLMKPLSGVDKTISDLYALENYIQTIIDSSVETYKKECSGHESSPDVDNPSKPKTIEAATNKVIKEIEISVIDILNKSDVQRSPTSRNYTHNGQFTSHVQSYPSDLEEEFHFKQDISPSSLAKLDTSKLTYNSPRLSEQTFQFKGTRLEDKQIDLLSKPKQAVLDEKDSDDEEEYTDAVQTYSDSDSEDDGRFLIQGIAVMNDNDISAIFGKRLQRLDSLSKGIDKSLEDIRVDSEDDREVLLKKITENSKSTDEASLGASQNSELQELENRIMKLEKKLVAPFPLEKPTSEYKDSGPTEQKIELVSPFPSDLQFCDKQGKFANENTHVELCEIKNYQFSEQNLASAKKPVQEEVVILLSNNSPVDSPQEMPSKESGSDDDSIIPIPEERSRSGTFDSEDTAASDTTSNASYDTVIDLNDQELTCADELDVSQEKTPTRKRIEEVKTPTPIDTGSSSDNEIFDDTSPNATHPSFKQTYKLNRQISEDFEGSFEDLVELNEGCENNVNDNAFMLKEANEGKQLKERQRSVSETLTFNFEPTSYFNEKKYEPTPVYLETVSRNSGATHFVDEGNEHIPKLYKLPLRESGIPDSIETTGIVEPSWDHALNFNKTLSEQCQGDTVHINFEAENSKQNYIPSESDSLVTENCKNTNDGTEINENEGHLDSKSDKIIPELPVSDIDTAKENEVITISGDESDTSEGDDVDSDVSSADENVKSGGYNISAISDSDKDSNDGNVDSGELSDSTDSTDSSTEVEACISEGLKYRYYHDYDDDEEEDDSDEEEMSQAMLVFRSMQTDRELHTIPEDPEIDLEYGTSDEEEEDDDDEEDNRYNKYYSDEEFEEDSDDKQEHKEVENKRQDGTSTEKYVNKENSDDDSSSEGESDSDSDEDDNDKIIASQNDLEFNEKSETTTDISIREYTEEDIVVRRRHIERCELYTTRTTVEETKTTNSESSQPSSSFNQPDYSLPSPTKKHSPITTTTTHNIPVTTSSVPTKSNDVVGHQHPTSSVSVSQRPHSPLGASAAPAPSYMGQRSGDVADTLFIEKALMESFFTNVGSIVFLIFAIVVFHLMDQWFVKDKF